MKQSFWIMALLVPFLGGACNGTGGEELLAQFEDPQLYEGEVDNARLAIGVSEIEESFVAVELQRCDNDELNAQFEFVGKFGIFNKEIEGPFSEFVEEGITLDRKGVSLVFEFDHNDQTYHLGINGKFTDTGIEAVIQVDFFEELVPIRVGVVDLDHVEIPPVQ